MIVIFTNFTNREDAVRIGMGLLEKRLVAAYDIWPVESAIWQKNKIVEHHRTAMLVRTTIRWYDDIAEYIKEQSHDDSPEVIALDSERIEPYYQKWLNDVVR
ncbi:MAG TPA: divalent cation tolerance protein CutA [Candidatus Saccharimonadia bacterium]|nr:divalent cation tolerance protein CutA [Candidatus Saccharimonadia bacterium]